MIDAISIALDLLVGFGMLVPIFITVYKRRLIRDLDLMAPVAVLSFALLLVSLQYFVDMVLLATRWAAPHAAAWDSSIEYLRFDFAWFITVPITIMVSGALIHLLLWKIPNLVQKRVSAATEPLLAQRFSRRVAQNAPIILFALDTRGVLLSAQGLGLDRLGINAADLPGKSIFVVFADSPLIVGDVHKALQGETVHSICEYRGVVLERWLDPERDEHGTVTGVTGISLDISDRKATEQQLEEREAQLRTLVESTLQGIMIIRAGRLLFVNQGFVSMFGFPDADTALSMETVDRVVDAKSLERIRKLTLPRDSNPPTVTMRDVTYLRYDGSTFVADHQDQVVDWGGEPARFITIVDVTERAQAAQELNGTLEAVRQREAELSAIIDKSPQGIVIHRDLKRLVVNQAFADIAGTTREDLLSAESTLQLYSEEHQARIRQQAMRVQTGTRTSGMFELPLRTKSGEERIVLSQASPIQWQGQPAVFNVSLDITERRRAEAELAASEARFRAMVDLSVHGIMILRNQKLLFVNEGFLRLFRFPDVETAMAIGSTRELLHSDSLARLLEPTEGDVVDPSPHYLRDMRFRRADGSEFYADHQGIEIEWEGEPARFVTLVDVTQRTEAERALNGTLELVRQREGELRTVLENALLGLSIQRDNKRLLVNQGYADFLGYTREELEDAETILHVLPAEEQAAISQRLAGIQDGTLAPEPTERTFVTKSGEQRHGLALSSRIIWQGEAAVLTMVIDVTERVRAQAERELAITALQQREAELSAIIENNLLGLTIHRNGKRLVVNQSYAELLGYTRQELLDAEHVLDLLPDAERADSTEHMARVLEGNSAPVPVERTLIGKDGAPRHVINLASRIAWQGQPSLLVMTMDVTERRKTEHALKASEARYRTLVETGGLGVIIHRKRFPLFTNPAAARLLGYENSEEFVARGNMEWMHEDDLDRIAALRQEYEQVGETLRLYPNTRCLRKDGSTIVLDGYAQTTEWEGQPATQLTLVDVTERFEQEQRFRLLVQHSVQPMLIHRKGVPLYANQAMADMVGFATAADVVAQASLTRIVGEESYAYLAAMRDQAEARGENIIHFPPTALNRQDGSTVIATTVLQPIEWEGEAASLITAMDVTEIMRAQDAQAEQAARYRSIIEHSQLGIVIHRNGPMVFANDTARSFLGIGPGEAGLKGVSTLDFLRAEEVATRRQIRDQKRAAGETSWYLPETALVSRDGRALVADLYAQEVEWEGEPAIQTMVVDATERRKLETQLRQAQKMEALGQLAGGVAHDFNNNLQVIMGWGESVLEDAHDAAAVTDGIKRMMEAGRAASTLTRQLLSFSRQDALQKKTVDVRTLVHNQIRMLERVLGAQVKVRGPQDGEPVTVHADEGALHQIILNMALNARDAMAEGGTLTLDVEMLVLDSEFTAGRPGMMQGGHAVLSISDTGHGMTTEVRERVFEPFYTTKDRGQGTGLGLAMVMGAVKQHHGWVDVYSEEKLGTTFRIYLPLKNDVAPQKDAALPMRVDGHGELVLVVEDNPAISSFLEKMLAQHGYRTLLAQDGEDARQLLETAERPDVVVTDMVMPRGSGREVYLASRKLSPAPPVLFITGFAHGFADQGLLEKHAAHVLRKPFSSVQLLTHLRRVLRTAQLGEAPDTQEDDADSTGPAPQRLN